MKVLVLGATGFIGLPVAQAFVRAGYEVYGQTRSESKVKLLLSEEIIPVVADPASESSWADVVSRVDVVIDCVGGNDIKALSASIFNTVVAVAKKTRPVGTPLLTFIYCSGTWVHGEDRINKTSERSPIKNTTSLVQWRSAHEQHVMSEQSVYGIVLRPSMLYGRSASLFEFMFQQAQPGKQIEWAGRTGGRYALIHCDDLADMFLRIAERAPICKGLAFDAANDFTESVEDVLNRLCKVSGASGWSYREPSNLFEEAMATTTLLRPSLARSLVDWHPRKMGLADGMECYYKAWQASK